MKLRKIELRIETQDEFFNRMEGYMKQIDRGARGKIANEGLSVESIEVLHKMLTPKRIQILKAIRACEPDSVYQLAKIVKRKQENVQADVKYLSDLRLINTRKNKKGRKRTIPRVDYDVLDFRVPITAGAFAK